MKAAELPVRRRPRAQVCNGVMAVAGTVGEMSPKPRKLLLWNEGTSGY